ncbi:MAG: sensor histidine kinase [Comamonadaceae bacterium]|nr:sensor histidine kinase [Comamonadaceae bacterium]
MPSIALPTSPEPASARTRRTISRLWLGLGLSGALLALAIGFAYVWFHQAALRDAEAQGNAAIQRLASDLMLSVEKFEHLPYLLGAEQMLTQALQAPDDPARIADANRYLLFAQRRTDVAAVYLMDTEGHTLAASNWDLPSSFVGRNYRFRPYFQDALKGGTGRFYAVGATTGEPGFFIAAPILAASQVIGVVAVKIDLNAFEDKWRAEGLQLALADEKGVLFLTTEPAWRYRSLSPLAGAVLSQLRETLQYGDLTPVTLTERVGTAPGAQLQAMKAGGVPYLVQGQALARFGWQLLLFSDPAMPRARGLLAAELVGMGLSLLLLLSALVWQYRRRLAERQASMRERAQVVAELEQRIATRTAELTAANDAAVQTGKLALLGQMAAGISHEISQPLTALRTLADNASKFLDRQDTGNAGNNLRLIGDLCTRMGSIVGELKAFARKEPARLQPVSLKHVIGSSLMLIEPMRHATGTRIISADTDAQVMGDPIRLEQVLVNLLRNGIDAMESQTARQMEIRVQITTEGDVCLSVQDQGAGLSPEVQQHLFEPFFTTKPSGKGLGLGLALSKAIVREMGGRIEAVNTHPGARFDLILRPAPKT